MRAQRIFRAIGLIDDRFLDIADNTPAKPYRSTAWVKYVSIAACFALVFGLVRWGFRTSSSTADSSGSNGAMPPGTNDQTTTGSSEGSDSGSGFAGASELCPVVMVNGRLYEWGQIDELPENAEFYGEVIRVDGDTPENDCELVYDSDASGEIYTVTGDDSVVYIVITTEQMNGVAVRFDSCD